MTKKKMTQREKTERARIKKELQQEGLLPPDKPRLNRKKFAAEVWEEWIELDPLLGEFYLLKAINCMVGPDMKKVTAEEVGVLKVLKIAIETKKFSERLQEEGREKYTLGEYMDTVVLPIREL